MTIKLTIHGHKVTAVIWAPHTPTPRERFIQHLTDQRYVKGVISTYIFVLREIGIATGKPIEQCTTADLDKWNAELLRSKRAPATVGKYQEKARVFFKWARDQEPPLVAGNPCRNLVAPHGVRRVPKHLTEAEVASLLASLSGADMVTVRTRAMVACMLYAGMRCGEVAGLQIENINLAEGYLVVLGKGSKERQLPIPAALAGVLSAWMRLYPRTTGRVLIRMDGTGYRAGDVSYHVKQALRNAGMGRFSAHILRHTFATRLIRRDVALPEIQILLGHASVATTQIYAHAELTDRTRAALETL
jgi:site-specific recombinase XerD